jgi:hypothetical protein
MPKIDHRKLQMTAAESNANRDRRWPRLFALLLWNFGFFSLGSLLGEASLDVWRYGLDGISLYLVLTWLGRAVGFGLFCGLFIAFGTCLSQALFGQSKKHSSQRPRA